MPDTIQTPARSFQIRRSLRASLFFEVFALLALSVGAVVTTAYLLASSEVTSRMKDQLSAGAQSRATTLENTIGKQREQISILAQDPKLTKLTTITKIVGFRQLIDVDAQGNSRIIAGSAETMEFAGTFLSSMRQEKSRGFFPVFSERGWIAYVIATPKEEDGKPLQGTLFAVFDAGPLVANLLHANYLGKTAEVLLTTTINGERMIIHGNDENAGTFLLRSASVSVTDDPIRKEKSQGTYEGKDYAGIAVIGAYRQILPLGWTVDVKIDRFELADPLVRLGMNLLSAGLFVVGFLSLSTFLLSRRIVGPLEELTGKVEGLETRRWTFERSIFTGNELESVDRAMEDVTGRLRKVLDHLESIVHERTEELRSEHAQDAAILQSMEDGLIVTDKYGVITYTNRAAAALLQWPDDSMRGRDATEVLLVTSKDGSMFDEGKHPLTMVIRSRQSWNPHIDPQLSVIRKDGKEVPLQLRITPILQRKRCTGAVALIRDATEERKLDRMKSEFITLVSHQLRTPLSSMRWYLEMLLGDEAGSLNDNQQSYIKEVNAANERMVQLVNALLNVSKIELGKFTLHPTPIDMGKTISNVIESLRATKEKKQIDIEWTQPDGIQVQSDPTLLTLIIENLISNAIKYSGGGYPVQVALKQSPDGKAALLTVKDHGIGIPTLQQHLIGRKLFRGTNATAVDTDGKGLGLYISSIAAETIGATLTFESTETEGTTFSLMVPLHPQGRVVEESGQ